MHWKTRPLGLRDTAPGRFTPKRLEYRYSRYPKDGRNRCASICGRLSCRIAMFLTIRSSSWISDQRARSANRIFPIYLLPPARARVSFMFARAELQSSLSSPTERTCAFCSLRARGQAMPSILRPRLLLLLVLRQSAGAQVRLLRRLPADAAFQNFPAGPIRGSLRKGRALRMCRRPAARNLSLWPRQALLRLALRGARHNSMHIGRKSPSFAPSWPLFSRPSTAMNLRRVRLNGHPAHRRLRSRRRRRCLAMRPPRLCPS